MAKHLIKFQDGTVGQMTVVEKAGAEICSAQDCLNKWHPNEKAKVAGCRLMLEGEIPSDRYFRGAWRHVNDRIQVDMPNAVEIHKNVLRKMRKPLLEQLDVEFMRALEAGDAIKQKAISDKKQELRDITKHSAIVNAKTPDELKSYVPSVLTLPLNI